MKNGTMWVVVWLGLGLMGSGSWVGGQETAEVSQSRSEYSSSIKAQKVAVLSAATDGIIRSINCEPQDFVAQDEILIQMDADLIDLEIKKIETQIAQSTDLRDARIRLEYAQENYKIIEALHQKLIESIPVGTKKELNEARQSMELAELNVEAKHLEMRLLELSLAQNQKRLAMHFMRAPWDGVIVPLRILHPEMQEPPKHPEVGEMVRAGQEVVALMKVDRLRVSLPIEMERLEEVSLGQDVEVYVSGFEDRPIPGIVVYKSPTIFYEVGLFNIEVEFANPPLPETNLPRGHYRYQFRPGLSARVVVPSRP